MKKFAKITNETTKECGEVGLGTDTEFYKSIGMTEMDIEQAYDGSWYVKGYAPDKPELTFEEVRALRATAYATEVDDLMSEYTRKKTFNLFDEGEDVAILTKIEAKVTEIKNRYPYPNGEDNENHEQVITSEVDNE